MTYNKLKILLLFVFYSLPIIIEWNGTDLGYFKYVFWVVGLISALILQHKVKQGLLKVLVFVPVLFILSTGGIIYGIVNELSDLVIMGVFYLALYFTTNLLE